VRFGDCHNAGNARGGRLQGEWAGRRLQHLGVSCTRLLA
jgi:hypothetical protein